MYFNFTKIKEGEYNESAFPSINFCMPNDNNTEELKNYLSSPIHPKFLYLLNPAYNFDFFKQAERTFSIISKNGTYTFNLDLLLDTSATIKEHLEHDPNNLEYHLHNEDKENIMAKIEKMYLGQKISITQKEYSVFNQIIYELNIAHHVSFNRKSSNKAIIKGLQIKLDSFHSYLRRKMPQPFTIYTKNNKYKCNMTGIKSSNIIKEILINNPKITEYKYEIDDEFGEFQQICDLFNFNFVKLTTDNMNSIKQMCEDLQIDVVNKDVDSFIDDYETRVQTIDDQQKLIESIDSLFDTLYKIKELSVFSVKSKIIESEWSKTEENVEELTAFILQVIQTDISLQPYILELIEILDKNANETNKLNILVPFLKRKLLFLFGKNKLVSSFIYRLIQKGFIKKEEIIKILRKKSLTEKINESLAWFLPELYEICNKDLEKFYRPFNKKICKFIQIFFPDNIDEFIKMRERGETDDKITKSLRCDDIDTFQQIISTNQIDVTKENVPYSIFDNFTAKDEISYINYSASYGSLKCFKYLILNHATIDERTFSLAVFGGNIEIIKIVDQTKNSSTKSTKQNSLTISLMKLKYDSNINILYQTIRKHQNDLFDWILDHKFSDNSQLNKMMTNILIESSKNGNSHAIISIIDRGFDFSAFDQRACQRIIKKSSKRGFYRLDKFLVKIMKKRFEQFDSLNNIFDPISAVIFGNVLIFQLYYQQEKNIDMKRAFLRSIEYENLGIVRYILENFLNKIFQMKQRDDFVVNLLSTSLENETNDVFNYLIEKIIKVKSNTFTQDDLIKLLSKACCLNKIEIVKNMTNIILENNNNEIDFTLPFFNSALSSRGSEICQFFIDKKVHIDYLLLSLQVSQLKDVNKDVFDIIIRNSTPEAKEIFNSFYLKIAIISENKHLIEYLLKEKKPDEDCLFEAVKTCDIEIVNMILNKNSDPSFINQVSNNGTAINLSVTSNYYEIFKRLLSIPGIDLNSCDINYRTPLINAIIGSKLNMINDILNLYDTENKSFQKQLNQASKEFLKIAAKKNLNEIDDEHDFLDIYKKLIDYEFVDVNQRVKNLSLFSFACKINQIEIVEKLLKSNRADVNSTFMRGNNPLFIAINNNNFEIAKLIINDDGIDINHRNNDKETALTLAVEKGLTELVDLIIKKEKFDPIKSRINYSFYRSNDEIATILIKCSDLDVNYKNIKEINYEKSNNKVLPFNPRKFNFNQGISINYLENKSELNIYMTPLYNATHHLFSKKVDLIINHPLFDPVKSLAKECIFLCCKNDDTSTNIDIFRKLIKIYNNDVNLVDSFGKSLFEISINNNQTNITEEIINNENFYMKKSNFLSNFCYYIKQKFISIDVVNKLIEYDKNHDNIIDFTKLLPNGRSFFTIISCHENTISQLVELFLSNGVDPNIPDEINIYPLEYAIHIKNINFIKALINSNKIDFSVKLNSTYSQSIIKESYQKADLDPLPEKKYTSYLHLAVNLYSDDKEILSLLLECNSIDINITDSLGETPLIEACRIKNKDVIDSLFEREELDYKHCNNNGDDALKISQKLFNNNDVLSPKSKDEYLNCLLKVFKEPSSNFTEVPNNTRANNTGLRFNFTFK